VHELDSLALILGQDIADESRGVVDSLDGLALRVADHETVSWEARGELVEGCYGCYFGVGAGDVLEGLFELLAVAVLAGVWAGELGVALVAGAGV